MDVPTGYLEMAAREAALDAYQQRGNYNIEAGFNDAEEFADYWLFDGVEAWLNGSPVPFEWTDGDEGEPVNRYSAEKALEQAYHDAAAVPEMACGEKRAGVRFPVVWRR